MNEEQKRDVAAEYADKKTKDYQPSGSGFGIVILWNEYFWKKYDELQNLSN